MKCPEPKVLWTYHDPELLSEMERAYNEESFLILLSPLLGELPELNLLKNLDLPERPIFGLCTTGTLGRKLILYSRKNLESSLKGILSFFDLEKIHSVYTYPQPYHVFGLVLGYLFPLLYKKQLLLQPGTYQRSAHENWFQRVSSGTMTLGTPTHFKDLIEWVEKTGKAPTASYTSIAGGAPVPKSLWFEMREKLQIENPSIGYGASELSPGATHLPPGKEPRFDAEIGTALPNVNLELLPEGGIRVRGPNVCLAILQGKKVEIPSYIDLRDEVRLSLEGSMVFNHRKDLILNRGGEKFSLEQIENLLKEKLALDAVGVKLSHPRLGEELALLTKSQGVDRNKIITLLTSELGRSFDENLIFDVEGFPNNGSQKIDRTACEKIARERHELSH